MNKSHITMKHLWQKLLCYRSHITMKHLWQKLLCYRSHITMKHLWKKLLCYRSFGGVELGWNHKSLTLYISRATVTNINIYTKHAHICFNSTKHIIIKESVNRIGDVIVSVLASSAVDRGFEPRLGQTKDYKICICCFSTKHPALRRKSKDWLARNQNNVSEWNDMSIRGLLFQWDSTINIQLGMLF